MSTSLEQAAIDLLQASPGSTTTELHRSLKKAFPACPPRAQLAALLGRLPGVVNDGGQPLRWSLDDAPPPKAQREEIPQLAPEPSAPPKVTDELPGQGLAKRDLITLICNELGVADVGIARGSTEPKELFLQIDTVLGLGLDDTRSKPELAETIAAAAGLPWDPDMDSRRSRSGGGDTVTARGLRRVLQAVLVLKEAAPLAGRAPAESSERLALAAAPVSPPGLHHLPPAQVGRGSGGEGPLHAAIKALIKERPFEAIGERLTYIDEDLSEHDPTVLGDEVRFITGDRVDLLMRDEKGRLVVIEVEPDIGLTGHIGFHQAAKYWVLVAVANGIELGQVRRMVAARSIDPTLAAGYSERYGIEAAVVPMVEGPDGWVHASTLATDEQPSRAVTASGGPKRQGAKRAKEKPSRKAKRESRAERVSASGTRRPKALDPVQEARVRRFADAYQRRHGRFTGSRHEAAVREVLAKVVNHDDLVVLEAIARSPRPDELKAAVESIAEARAKLAPRRSPVVPQTTSKPKQTKPRAKGVRGLLARGAAIGERPLYESPKERRYCPGCGLLEINCHCG